MSAPGLRPSIVSALTLFPDPDSPATPSVRPASTSKERPRTAWTRPSDVGKETVRFSTLRRLTMQRYCTERPAAEAAGLISCCFRSVLYESQDRKSVV